MNSHTRRKPISFRGAVLIVVGLHVVGFIGLHQWSSYKFQKAKAEKRAAIARKESDTKEWNPKGLKPVVVAIPKPIQVKSKEDKEVINIFNNLLTVRKTMSENVEQLADSYKQALVRTTKYTLQIDKPSTKNKPTTLSDGLFIGLVISIAAYCVRIISWLV